MDILSLFLETGFWLATVRMATPLIFGTMGELICERAGVLNLGIEGIMAAGCMSGWTWVFLGGTLWGGVLFAACVGAALGLLHAVFTVHLGLSQHVTGLGITMLGASLSSFVFRMVLPQVTTPPKIIPFAPLDIPVLSSLPFLGPVLFSQTALTLLAFILVGVTAYVLLRTPSASPCAWSAKTRSPPKHRGSPSWPYAPARSWSAPPSWPWAAHS